jgi:hypothetical protein
LCKDCATLGTEELEYRQAVRDIDRMLTDDGHIRRKSRRQFEKYFAHQNERLRAYALEIEMQDAWDRAESRLYDDLDDFLLCLADEEDVFPHRGDPNRASEIGPLDEIPF